MPVRSLEGIPREEGVRDLVIAWTLNSGFSWIVISRAECTYPWNVPARTSRSLTETLLRAELKSRLKTRPPALLMIIRE